MKFWMSILNKKMIVEMCVKGCDMAALFKVIHVIGEDDAPLEIRKHALTTTLAVCTENSIRRRRSKRTA
jgi:hypothetical protein